jgi:hypothetical protein
LKLQRLQNKVLCNTGNFPSHTSSRELHVTFKIPHVYDFITQLCRQQAEIQNHENANVRNIEQGEAMRRKYKRLKLGGGQAYNRSGDYADVKPRVEKIRHNLLCKAWTDKWPCT